MTARRRRCERNPETYRADSGPGLSRNGNTRRSDVRLHRAAVYRRVRSSHAGRAGIARRAVVRKGKSTMAESYNGYCVKCKDKRDFDGDIAETNGRRMAKGTCPVCGTRMNRILGKT